MFYREAIAFEHYRILRDDPKAVILGVGVNDGAKYVFGTTGLAAEKFTGRVVETPLSETMLTGALIGMANNGWHPTFVHARADFLYLSAEHLLNTAATYRFIHGIGCPITVRAIIGEGWGNGPMHTKAPLEMFNVEGIDLFTPQSIFGIRRAMNNAVATGNPTVILERRRYYEQESADGDESEPRVDWTIPRGPAPASAPLERAYYEGGAVAPAGGPF